MWAIFLRYAENPDHREVVNRIIEAKEGLYVASELLMGISQDEKERAHFRSRRMYLSDLESNILTATRTGREQGQADAYNNIAKKLLAVGDPIEKIEAVTGLTRAEIEALRDAD